MSKVLSKFKWSVKIIVFAIVCIVAILHQTIGGGFNGAPTVHAICPFGALESLFNLITGQSFIAKTYYSNIVFLIGSSLLVILFGRIFCGWLCAFGTLQDLFSSLGKKILGKRFLINRTLDYYLKYLKYFILFIILYLTWKTGELIIAPYDPFAAFSHIPAGIGEVINDYTWGFTFLILILFSSLFYDNIFCKYICPLGAFYSILSKISVFKIIRDNSTCINCKKCDKVCPVNIEIQSNEVIKSSECLSCMRCIDSCPTKKNSLSIKISKTSISPLRANFIGLGTFIAVILISKSMGYMKTMPNTMSEVIAGNPDKIRGWMSMEQIITEFKLDKEKFYNELGIEEKDLPLDTTVKKSEEVLKSKGIEFDHDKIGEIIKKLIN
ncbi:4Fe-4S binding protein [Cetobacterium sp. 8H]|uniref:4Fe-4S binding protein n=1 Tax=Cetobacterium sp. 8H TaxID=2759681 RepID=UPI00163BE54F|nr:4Fe-4S binding protein [Cetobacterium sp. 8H]MBC2852078.1 4Fe-4S binding protein [Cetobacterium sp. 8H]